MPTSGPHLLEQFGGRTAALVECTNEGGMSSQFSRRSDWTAPQTKRFTVETNAIESF